jgi:hypothetical protein
VFDQGEGNDILDAIVAEGRCGTCGTPWDHVVNVEGKRPMKIEGGCPTSCASWATGDLVPPGQARMADTWADYSGCWAACDDDDHEEMRACEPNPHPRSALGLCAEHDAHLAAFVKQDA